MKHIIHDRKEKKLFSFFEELSAIPHPSGKEEAISTYLMDFAKERSIPALRDAHNNVLMKISASPDQAHKAPVILQGHMDMVFITDENHRHHQDTTPISLQYDGKWVWAEGTSLGGDNGVALAVMLALADQLPSSHPPLELLFTASEEIGLIGAKNFDCSLLEGKRLINLDGGEEQVAVIGCAGGRRLDLTKALPFTDTKTEGLSLTLFGLQGGHSGAQIHQPLGNALKEMGLLLSRLEPSSFHLASCQGGTVDNAIASQCQVTLIPAHEDGLASLQAQIQGLLKELLPQWKKTDPDAAMEITSCTVTQIPQNYGLDFLCKLMQKAPHGVQAFSKTHPDTVADSMNFAKIETTHKNLTLTFSVRSFSEEKKEALCQKVALLAKEYGFSLSSKGDYPGWEPRTQSALLDAYLAANQEVFGTKARYYPIHAGLECGIFSKAIANLDAISIGCDILDIHSPDERMDADSLERLYRLMQVLLSQL